MAASRRTTRGKTNRSSRSSGRRGSHGAGFQKSSAPAVKWIAVMRSPAPGVGFEVQQWVPITALTVEEKEKYLNAKSPVVESQKVEKSAISVPTIPSDRRVGTAISPAQTPLIETSLPVQASTALGEITALVTSPNPPVDEVTEGFDFDLKEAEKDFLEWNAPADVTPSRQISDSPSAKPEAKRQKTYNPQEEIAVHTSDTRGDIEGDSVQP